MQFIADEMLGRLAKWLRIFGYDTLYFRHIRDSELLRLSILENRLLLTRDTRLVSRRGIQKKAHVQRFLNMYAILRMNLANAHRAAKYTGKGLILQRWRKSWQNCSAETVEYAGIL